MPRQDGSPTTPGTTEDERMSLPSIRDIFGIDASDNLDALAPVPSYSAYSDRDRPPPLQLPHSSPSASSTARRLRSGISPESPVPSNPRQHIPSSHLDYHHPDRDHPSYSPHSLSPRVSSSQSQSLPPLAEALGLPFPDQSRRAAPTVTATDRTSANFRQSSSHPQQAYSQEHPHRSHFRLDAASQQDRRSALGDQGSPSAASYPDRYTGANSAIDTSNSPYDSNWRNISAHQPYTSQQIPFPSSGGTGTNNSSSARESYTSPSNARPSSRHLTEYPALPQVRPSSASAAPLPPSSLSASVSTSPSTAMTGTASTSSYDRAGPARTAIQYPAMPVLSSSSPVTQTPVSSSPISVYPGIPPHQPQHATHHHQLHTHTHAHAHGGRSSTSLPILHPPQVIQLHPHESPGSASRWNNSPILPSTGSRPAPQLRPSASTPALTRQSTLGGRSAVPSSSGGNGHSHSISVDDTAMSGIIPGNINNSGSGADLADKTIGRYSCPYCGKRFNRPSSLKIHVNTHTGAQPFQCPFPECGRKFSVLSNMRRHARVHTQYFMEVPEGEGPDRATSESPSNGAVGRSGNRRTGGSGSGSTGGVAATGGKRNPEAGPSGLPNSTQKPQLGLGVPGTSGASTGRVLSGGSGGASVGRKTSSSSLSQQQQRQRRRQPSVERMEIDQEYEYDGSDVDADPDNDDGEVEGDEEEDELEEDEEVLPPPLSASSSAILSPIPSPGYPQGSQVQSQVQQGGGVRGGGNLSGSGGSSTSSTVTRVIGIRGALSPTPVYGTSTPGSASVIRFCA